MADRTGRAAALLPALLLLAAAGCVPELGLSSRVVIVTLDTTRADRLGCYGDENAATPNLDRLAAESVLFEQAISPVPTTLPSHCTMFTGLYPQDHGVRYNNVFRLGDDAATLAELFRDAGFRTGAVVASHVLSREFGLGQGFETYIDPPPRPPGHVGDPASAVRPAEEGVDLALEWLGDRPGDPELLWLHLYDPHWPYDPPFPFSSQFRDRPYDGEIAYMDRELGRLLDALREDPAWERTLVVVAGDHGEGLYEHGERFHANLIYESTQRVPLIVRAPGAPPRRVAEPVTLADLLPTVLDLSGIPVPGELRGLSLRGALQSGALPQRPIYVESLSGAISFGWAELKGVRMGSWKLIQSAEPELFDLASDPQEMENRAADEPGKLTELRSFLAEVSAPSSAMAAAGATAPDRETAEMLAALGYLGAAVAGGAPRENAPHPREMVDLDGEIMYGYLTLLRGRWPKVEDVARHVLERDPGNKWGLQSRAEALIHLDRAKEAVEVAEELVRVYPGHENGHTVLARAHGAAGSELDAHRVLTAAREEFPGSEPIAYLAVVAALDAELESACMADLSFAIQNQPTSWRVRVAQARCEARGGNPEKALESLKRAVFFGFTEMELIRELEEFAAVVALPGFDDLGLIPGGNRDHSGIAAPPR